METNGPRKDTGGGSCAHSEAKAGGCGKVPPASGCSPGCAFTLGLYGTICEKSGRGSETTCSTSGSSSLAAAALAAFLFVIIPTFCKVAKQALQMYLNV